MPTVSFDSFLPELSPIVPGCPEPVVTNALRTAAAEFCRRTLCWQVRLAEVAVTSASFPYAIPIPTHAQLSRVKAAHVGKVKLNPTNYEVLDQLRDWDTQLGTASHYLVEPDDTLVVFPKPSTATDLRLTVVYGVARSAVLLETFLYDQHRDALVHGALRLLTAMPDRAWSRPNDVVYHTSKFEQAVQATKVDVNSNSRAPGDLHVAPRSFA